MKNIGSRITFLDIKDQTTIVIQPDKNPLVNAMMGAWLAMWLVIGITLFWSLLYFNLSKQEKIIIYIFFVFWFYYAFKVFKAFIWLMFGKELLKIDNLALNYKKSIFNYGKSTPYYLENITKFSLTLPKVKSIHAVWDASPWVIGGERFHFEYFSKVIYFGRKIPEAEAKLLFQLINKRIQERLKK